MFVVAIPPVQQKLSVLLVVLNVGGSAFYKIHGQEVVFLPAILNIAIIASHTREEYHARNKAWYEATRLHSRLVDVIQTRDLKCDVTFDCIPLCHENLSLVTRRSSPERLARETQCVLVVVVWCAVLVQNVSR